MGEAKRKRDAQSSWHEVTFLDSGREPQVPPNPEFPDGMDVDLTEGIPVVQSCKVMLPYPAPRCGAMAVHCRRCNMKIAATVAGRPDDPRSLRMPCGQQPGPTGDYPHGISKRPGDEGGIAVAVSDPDSDGNIYIDFGKPVAWLSLPKDKVMELAIGLMTKAGARIEQIPNRIPESDKL